jgi:predicted dehydrogenase
MNRHSITRRGFAAAATAASVGQVVGANDRIRLALIGAGGRGSSHLTDLNRLKDLNVTIAGVADVWRPNRERAVGIVAKNFGAKPQAVTDYRRLLESKEIDAVVIAVPDFAHPIVLKAAVEAGKDAYVEKPFGTTFPEVKAAYLAVRKSKQVVQVGTQRRSDPLMMGAAKLIRAGAIGKVTRIDIGMHFQAPRWKRPPETIAEQDVDWKTFQMGRIAKSFDPRLLREWQLFPETTNGIPGLWMSHFIDLIPWYLDDPYPSGAVSMGGVYLWKDGRVTSDVFQTLLEYPKDFMVSFSMSLTNSYGVRQLWMGTRGTADLEKGVITGEGSSMKDKVAGEIRIEKETTNSHMHNFLECIRSRQTPRADVQAGFSHAVAGIMASEALAKGRRMGFDRERLEITAG